MESTGILAGIRVGRRLGLYREGSRYLTPVRPCTPLDREGAVKEAVHNGVLDAGPIGQRQAHLAGETIMSLDAVGIVSEDTEKCVRFYKFLGVELKRYKESEHFEGMTPSGVRILVDSVSLIQSFDPGWKKVRGTGVVLCFKQDSAILVDQLYEAMTRAGYDGIKAPWDAFWGQRYACISDPDGNQVDLFASL